MACRTIAPKFMEAGQTAKARILLMEGSMMMGLGYALSEEVHFNKGAILDLNFDTYPIPRFSWNGGPGISLQRTTSLTETLWQDVPGTEGQTSVSLPATDATTFFRLFKQ